MTKKLASKNTRSLPVFTFLKKHLIKEKIPNRIPLSSSMAQLHADALESPHNFGREQQVIISTATLRSI